jgi:pimeloyl-ACP methyl ester carboxylesterase
MVHTHQTAPTQFVEANGIRFAYRRFGKSGGVPLVFNQHFTGTMDHWDPAVTDGFAKDREVVLFDNAGISNSSGEVPASIEAFAKWAAPRENPYDYPKALRQPTLVVNGSADVIIYTVNSFILQQHIPTAQLILYPDANHGSQYQYPELFVRRVSMFLSEQDGAATTPLINPAKG